MGYGTVDHDKPVTMIEPDDPHGHIWENADERQPGVRGLAIDWPDSFGAVIVGTLDQLATWAQRVTDTIAAEQAEGYEQHHLERETSVTVHGMTAAQYAQLHDRLSLPRGYMGKWRGYGDERRTISLSDDEWSCGSARGLAEALAYLREQKADFTVWHSSAVRHIPRS